MLSGMSSISTIRTANDKSQAAQLRSPVLTAIGLVNRKPLETFIFDHPQNWHASGQIDEILVIFCFLFVPFLSKSPTTS